MHSRRRDERGSMLIVAIGILTLLSVLALTFVSIMKLERTASTNYVDGVRARLVAEGGLELTAAQIRLRASGEAFSNPNADWIYAQGRYWVPVEESSAVRRGAPDDQAAFNDIRASFAGSLGVTYAGGLDQYKVKVIDTQTQFNLNSNFEVIGEVDQVYVRFLDSLGVAIGKLNRRTGSGTTAAGAGRNPIANARYPKGSPNAWKGGEAIYRFRQLREGKRLNSKTELMEVLANEDDYNILQDYVTTRSWFDPSTVTAISQDGMDRKAWTDVQKKEARSPINLNLATEEVIAANLSGIAARGIFLYTGDYDTRDSRMQQVDMGTQFANTNGQFKEEVAYGTTGVLVYISPFGHTPATTPGDPPRSIFGALEFARLIKLRIRNTGPFQSFSEWEDFVDTTLTDAVLESTPDPDGGFAYPGHNRGAANPRCLQLNEQPLTTPSEADVKRHPRYKSWFYESVRSMIKANFNPNARLSGWNPDACVYMPVDKGGLLYFVDPNQPAAVKAQRQTCEWCLSSRGIFEITSLGEVLGAPPEDATKGTERVIFAQSKVQAVLQLYDTKIHTSQRDFERKGTVYQADRSAMTSYPVPRIYWDPRAFGGPNAAAWADDGRGEYLAASDSDGHIQLSTRSHEAQGTDPNAGVTFDTTIVDLGVKRFELLFQDRRVEQPGVTTAQTQRDPLQADSSGGVRHHDAGAVATGRIGNGFGWPFGTARDGVSSSSRLPDPRVEWRWDVLTPDGYLNTELRKTLLWYRASDENSVMIPGIGTEPDGRLRGKSAAVLQPPPTVSGNVAPTPKGGFELWYKPDFDWAMPQGGGTTTAGAPPDQRYCGLLATSHILQNMSTFQGGASKGQPGSWTRGTQMFLTRNTQGDLRITRLYFEVVGPQGNAQEEPYVSDPLNPANFISFTQYYDQVKVNYAYPWPPKELLTIPAPFDRIRWARTDHWVPFASLRDWRAHEWHHLAALWDDHAGTVTMWLDGRATPLVSRAPTQLGPRYVPKVVNPLGPTQPPVPAPQGNPPGPAELPSFVRLNALTGPTTAPAGDQAAYEEALRPKDQIVIGAIARDQAVVGGLFKHERDALLPANGTLDEVRFFDGSRAGAMTTLDRYETGEWMSEFDLTSAFQDGISELRLASLNMTAYLPRRHGATPFPNGSGSVLIEFRVLEPGKTWSEAKYTFPHWQATFDSVRGANPSMKLTDSSDAPVRVLKTDRLVYRVTLTPATANGFAVASPVVDDVQLVYYLSNPVVLLKERVNN